MSDLGPLPPDLRSLFDDERAAYVDDVGARERIMRRIEASIAFAAVGTAAGVAAAAAPPAALSGLSALAKSTKVLVVLSLATGIAVGETHARWSAPRAAALAPASSAPALPAAAATAAASASDGRSAPELPAVDVSSLPTSPPLPVPPPASAAPAPTPLVAPAERASDLAAEQALIDTARAALSRARGADALRAADDHARQFPRGRLSEERETLAIQALLLIGKQSEAIARTQRFHRTYPQSMYGGAVDALVASAPQTSDGGAALDAGRP
jgi:hypothetical protein